MAANRVIEEQTGRWLKWNLTLNPLCYVNLVHHDLESRGLQIVSTRTRTYVEVVTLAKKRRNDRYYEKKMFNPLVSVSVFNEYTFSSTQKAQTAFFVVTSKYIKNFFFVLPANCLFSLDGL